MKRTTTVLLAAGLLSVGATAFAANGVSGERSQGRPSVTPPSHSKGLGPDRAPGHLPGGGKQNAPGKGAGRGR